LSLLLEDVHNAQSTEANVYCQEYGELGRFLDSDFSFSQFADDMLDERALSKMSRRGVERVNFLGGQYFVRQESKRLINR
jgi:hypothetical protein